LDAHFSHIPCRQQIRHRAKHTSSSLKAQGEMLADQLKQGQILIEKYLMAATALKRLQDLESLPASIN
jgi:hypothetical protein